MRALLFALLFPVLCLASDWQPIPGTNVEYDRASLSRDNDNVKAWTKSVTYNGGSPVETTVDCQRRSVLDAHGFRPASPDSPEEKAVNALCKRAWEVWK